jgi:hypothetical protein
MTILITRLLWLSYFDLDINNQDKALFYMFTESTFEIVSFFLY